MAFCTPLNIVVPLAGTWIETLAGQTVDLPEWSCPLRARGLKLLARAYELEEDQSCPLRARGLKPFQRKPYQYGQVVPLAGTWIETPK